MMLAYTSRQPNRNTQKPRGPGSSWVAAALRALSAITLWKRAAAPSLRHRQRCLGVPPEGGPLRLRGLPDHAGSNGRRSRLDRSSRHRSGGARLAGVLATVDRPSVSIRARTSRCTGRDGPRRRTGAGGTRHWHLPGRYHRVEARDNALLGQPREQERGLLPRCPCQHSKAHQAVPGRWRALIRRNVGDTVCGEPAPAGQREAPVAHLRCHGQGLEAVPHLFYLSS